MQPFDWSCFKDVKEQDVKKKKKKNTFNSTMVIGAQAHGCCHSTAILPKWMKVAVKRKPHAECVRWSMGFNYKKGLKAAWSEYHSRQAEFVALQW